MKLDQNETFRKGKTYEDRLPAAERPRVEAAIKRRGRLSHMRGARSEAGTTRTKP